MKALFGGPLSPLGWSVGFIRVPFTDALRATVQWRESLSSRDARSLRVGERLELNGDASRLIHVMLALDPLQTPPKKELLIGTDRGWTLSMVNNHLGGDSVSWVGHLSSQLRCEGVLASHIPEGEYQYPATSFSLLGPSGPAPLHYVRSIAAGKFDSGRWEFLLDGEPQPFEELERYGAKRIRDRFTRDLLLRYLAALGIEPDQADFYTEAVLLETEAAFPLRESSLAQTQREYGIES